MANSRIGMQTKAITEGAVMAGLTAVLAMAGIYIPVLTPLVSLIWTLPVVVVCLRYGMKAGTAAMAVAGFVLMLLATPLNAVDMLIRAAGPALVLGYGFHRGWSTEKTVLSTAVAAFAGIMLSLGLSVMLMGMSMQELFTLDADSINEMVRMMADYGLPAALKMTEEELAAYFTLMSRMIVYLLPAIFGISGLTSAITNFMVANMVLGKLKIPLPPVTKLAAFRLPIGFVFVFILGFGLAVTGGYFLPGYPAVPVAGQNIMILMLAFFFFQGLGLTSFYIRKTGPPVRRALKAGLIVLMIMYPFLLAAISFIGVADAVLDFRRLEPLPEKRE